MIAVYQAEAGFLLPERCIVSYVEAAHRLGAEIHARERVIGWEVGKKKGWLSRRNAGNTPQESFW
jgi:sarcosine oxidase